MVAADPAGMAPLSEALAVVAEHPGQLDVVRRRIRKEHPVRKAHLREYDDGVLDVMTEVCAFAWAARNGALGAPAFASTGKGTPDLRLESGTWIEAKAVHPSDVDRRRTAEMLKTGAILSGNVRVPGEGFHRKFEYHYDNALAKFARQGATGGIVFFNLSGVDMDSFAAIGDVLDGLRGWADGKERQNPAVGVVLVHNYGWSHPVRDRPAG